MSDRGYERYNFICRKQRKNESSEQFHAGLVELAAWADSGNREDEWVRDMLTARLTKGKIAEELLAKTRSPQTANKYAIRLEPIHSVKPIRGQLNKNT